MRTKEIKNPQHHTLAEIEDSGSHTSTRSLSQPYVLGALDVEDWYEAQAVTEFNFLTVKGKQDGWDIQSTDPPNGFVGCP